jgi:hypothetical protein
MNKTIQTTVVILIVVLVSGIAGVSVLFFSRGLEEEIVSLGGYTFEIDKADESGLKEEKKGFIKHTSEIFPLELEYPEHLQIEKTVAGENIIEGTNINPWAGVTIKDDEKRVFHISANRSDMMGSVMLYTSEKEETVVDGRKAVQVRKANEAGGDDFDFFVQTIVEFPNFFYVFLSDGENDYYDEILSSVRFLEESDVKAEKELEACNTSKCYADVAISVNNYFICEKLLDRDGLHAPGWIPSCYTYIAIEKSDKKICDLINSPERSVSFPGHTEWCYCSVEKGEMCPLAIP